jgi:uncharacterized membrane protein
VIFLFVLTVATIILLLIPTRGGRRPARDAARQGMAAAMAFAGASHFLMPTPFVQHLPTWVPAAEALVYITGAIEVALGAALLTREPRRRMAAGLALAAYLVAVFPANVYVAIADVEVDGQPGGIYPWIRLPLQALFIAWALWSTNSQAHRTLPLRAALATASGRTHR